jgi:hypothetical protein
MQNPEPDLTDVDETIDEIALLQSQIQKKTIRSLMRGKELMTPSQQTRYFSMFEEHVRGMGRGQGRRVRGKRGRGAAWSGSARAPRGYNQNMGYGMAPARGIGRGMARAGA